MALSGFVVSVRESLLYAPAREAITRIVPGSGLNAMVRRGPFGNPVFNPTFPSWSFDPSLTEEEINEQRDLRERLWEEAEAYEDDEEPEVIEEAKPGRPMRDLSDMTEEELRRLRTSAVLGVLGTFIWAFGDLFGGLPR